MVTEGLKHLESITMAFNVDPSKSIGLSEQQPEEIKAKLVSRLWAPMKHSSKANMTLAFDHSTMSSVQL